MTTTATEAPAGGGAGKADDTAKGGAATGAAAGAAAAAAAAATGGDEQLGEKGLKALREERAAKAELEREVAALREKAQNWDKHEEASKSEQQKLTEKLAALEAEKQESTTKALRLEVAIDKNLPAKLLPFLTGSTKDEVEKHADALLEALAESGGTTRRVPAGNASTPGGGEGVTDPNSALRAAFRR